MGPLELAKSVKPIPVGDPRRDANLAKHMKGNDPMVPHVMYHGTAFPNIDKFSGYRGSAGHFAFDPKFAHDWARSSHGSAELDEEDWGSEKGTHLPQIYPVHLSAKRLFNAANPEHAKAIGAEPSKVWDYNDLEHHIPDMKKAGFDSYIDYEHGVRSPEGPTGIAVFHPHQVKSATGNNGNFNPSNPDITKADGGDVEGYGEGGFIPHGDPRRDENLARHMAGSQTPPVLYHGTHGDIKQFKRTKGAHFGFHFGDIEAANNRLEDLADKHPWNSEDLKERDKISTGHFNNLKAFEETLRRKNAEVPHHELTSALEKGEDIGPIFKKYEYSPTEQEASQLANLHHAYKSSQFPIVKTGEGSNIGAYHVAIKNPLRMNDVGDWGSLKKIKSALPFDSDAKSHGDLINELNSRGYDGVVYSNRVENPVMKTNSYIAFHPHQIKSATGNNGNFNPRSPDINKAGGGGTVRRAYMKGGKVEGSIWHGKDANVEYGEPTNSAIVQHVLAKIAAPLPASVPPLGNVTGRRQ